MVLWQADGCNSRNSADVIDDTVIKLCGPGMVHAGLLVWMTFKLNK